jgi:CMP-2-keto-3-deoxyoctulosonic acid synthetase
MTDVTGIKQETDFMQTRRISMVITVRNISVSTKLLAAQNVNVITCELGVTKYFSRTTVMTLAV